MDATSALDRDSGKVLVAMAAVGAAPAACTARAFADLVVSSRSGNGET